MSTVAEFFADLARTEERVYPCDWCHIATGVEFFDQFWVCADCRVLLDYRLRLCEEIPETSNDARNQRN